MPPDIVRLHIGCGKFPRPGWINSDNKVRRGVELVADLRDGLPFAEGSVDIAAAIHVLPHIPIPRLVPIVAEMRRVLKPGGVLRLALPDLDKAIDAYRGGDSGYFMTGEAWSSPGARLITQILWHGDIVTPFTYDFAAEILARAGFGTVHRCAFRETRSRHPEIVELDNRQRESFFVEAVR